MAFHPSQYAQSQLQDDDNDDYNDVPLTGAQKAAKTRKQNREIMEREASEASQRPRGVLHPNISIEAH